MIYKIIIFALFVFFACTPEVNHDTKETIKKTEDIDSLKVFFYSFGKKGLDSLSALVSKKIMADKGFDFDKLFKEISASDTAMSYEYYAQYSYNLAMKGRPDVALNYLNKGAGLAKNKSRYYFDKALMWGYIQPLGARDSVYFYLNEAVSHDSLNAYYYAARAKFYNEDALNDRALKDLNKAVFLDPRDTSYLNLRGEAKVFFKDYKSAYEDLKNIASINLNVSSVRIAKAYCLVKLNKIKECFTELEIAIKINPNIGTIYSVRAIAKEKSGDHEGAIDDLKKGASLGDKECIEYMKKYEEYQKTHKKV